MKRRKLLKPTIVALVFIFSFVVSMGTLDSVSNTDTVNGSLEVVSVESVDGEVQESGKITQVSILSETLSPSETPSRCHLIGYQLTGENANTRNLITGTRYMNVEGMTPFENMVAF